MKDSRGRWVFASIDPAYDSAGETVPRETPEANMRALLAAARKRRAYA